VLPALGVPDPNAAEFAAVEALKQAALPTHPSPSPNIGGAAENRPPSCVPSVLTFSRPGSAILRAADKGSLPPYCSPIGSILLPRPPPLLTPLPNDASAVAVSCAAEIDSADALAGALALAAADAVLGGRGDGAGPG
jgi:hypothetical protein